MKASKETQEKAKELGLNEWESKSEEQLQEEIEYLRVNGKPMKKSSTRKTKPVDEKKEKPLEKESKADEANGHKRMAELTRLLLELGADKKIAEFSIKMRDSKSPFFKYKDLLDEL